MASISRRSKIQDIPEAKEWKLAMTMARVLAKGMPDRLEWLKNQVDAITECGDTAGALQLLNYADETLSLKDFLVVKTSLSETKSSCK